MVTSTHQASDNVPIDSRLLDTLAHTLRARGQMLCTAESCTGGMIAARCTDLAGSSDWFDRGFVTYSNAAKQAMLDVPAELLASHGAVSEPVAKAMAKGALHHAQAQWAVAVTGIAGPAGGSVDKPVGTIWIAWAGPFGLTAQRFTFSGDRHQVRQQTVEQALEGLQQHLLRS